MRHKEKNSSVGKNTVLVLHKMRKLHGWEAHIEENVLNTGVRIDHRTGNVDKAGI